MHFLPLLAVLLGDGAPAASHPASRASLALRPTHLTSAFGDWAEPTRVLKLGEVGSN